VLFYSPGIIKNKTTNTLFLTISNSKKNLDNYICCLDRDEVLGIPFEYLDGTLHFIDETTSQAYKSVSLEEIFKNPNQAYKEEINVSKTVRYIINKKKYKVRIIILIYKQ